MAGELWVAVMVAAAGTLLMRLLPLVWMQRRLAREDSALRRPLGLGHGR